MGCKPAVVMTGKFVTAADLDLTNLASEQAELGSSQGSRETRTLPHSKGAPNERAGNVSKTAKLLRVSRPQFYNFLRLADPEFPEDKA